MRDVEPDAPERDGKSARLPPRAPDPAAARLFAALQCRPGHALVVGEHPAAAAEFFAKVDVQLACYRRLRVDGRGLDPEAVVRAIGADFARADPPPSLAAIVTALAAEARAAEVPVLVAVSRAEEAGARRLERLRALVEVVPEARDAVRLVLLGGPRLIIVLTQPEARELSARLLTTVYVPPGEVRTVLALPEPVGRARRWRRPGTRSGLAVVLAGLALLLFWTTHDVRPPAMPPPAEPPIEGNSVEPSRPPVAVAPASTPPDAPAPSRTTPAPPHREGLQVGAFLRPENAQALRERMARLFNDVEVVSVTRGGVRYHSVRVRAADGHQLAARAAALRAAGYAPVRVRD